MALAPGEYLLALQLVEEDATTRISTDAMFMEDNLTTSSSMPDLQGPYEYEYDSTEHSLNSSGAPDGEAEFHK